MTININLFFPTRRKYEMKAPAEVFSTETDQGLNHLPRIPAQSFTTRAGKKQKNDKRENNPDPA